MWFQLSILCIYTNIFLDYTQRDNSNCWLVSLAGFFHQEAATIALHQGFEKGVGIEPWTEPHFSRPEPRLCRGKTGARRF